MSAIKKRVTSQKVEKMETTNTSETTTTTTTKTATSSSQKIQSNEQTNKIENLKNIQLNNKNVINSEVNNENDNDSEKCLKKEKKKKSKKSEKILIDENSGEVIEKPKKKKSKKSKDVEKENISVRSSFNKFDALQHKNFINVRSSDPSKTQEKFNELQQGEKHCRACEKIVFQMEQIKAEKCIWHKSCFRCQECGKQLNVDTYQSHDGILYCKPHFKALFTPKAVEDNEPVKKHKPEVIIHENQPVELPPDVIRASDKVDLGLEELQSLNVKEKFQMFENRNGETTPKLEKQISRDSDGVKRSTSILSKLAKFHAKGFETGVNQEILNGIQLEESSSDGEEEDDEDEDESEEEDDDTEKEKQKIIKSKKIRKEKPKSLANINEVKTRFEKGHAMTKEERREERKQEIQNIRSRLFMGKQARIKEMYQQAVLESESGNVSSNRKPDIEIGDKAKSIKERFERGEAFVKRESDDDDEENKSKTNKTNTDQEIIEQGISKQSRSIFLEIDANVSKTLDSPQTHSPRTPDRLRNAQRGSFAFEKKEFNPDELIRADDKLDDVKIETAEISSKFKFFETYKPEEKEKRKFRITPPRDGVVKIDSPEREIYRDPNIVRGDEKNDQSDIVNARETTKKMLSIFRQMEEKQNEPKVDLIKPLKRFTPPLDEGRRIYNDDSDSDNVTDSSEYDSDEEDDEEEEDELYNRSNKYEDEYLGEAKLAERAKQLRAKFEKWESNEIKKEQNNSSINLYENNEDSQVESAKSIREKFESMRNSTAGKEKRDQVRVNRFV